MSKKPAAIPSSAIWYQQVGSTETPILNSWQTTRNDTNGNWINTTLEWGYSTGTSAQTSQGDLSEPVAVFEVHDVTVWANHLAHTVHVGWEERRWKPGAWTRMTKYIQVENHTVTERLVDLFRRHREAIILHDMWDELIMEANL